MAMCTMTRQAGLLVVVSQKGEDAPVHIEMTTDAADPVVLHWGVSPAGRRNDWIQPGKDILPEESVRIENGIAAETVFQARYFVRDNLASLNSNSNSLSVLHV